MKTVIRIIALLLAAALGISLIGCKDTEQVSSLLESTPTNTDKPSNMELEASLMTDGNSETYWSPRSNEEASVIIDLGSEKSFNIIRMVEHKNYLLYYFLEIEENGQWVQIYRQDEMENRTGVLDKTYTADKVKLTALFRNTKGGIADISFELLENKGHKMRNLSYCRGGQLERMRTNGFDKLETITDLVIFDFGCWTVDGEFKFGSMVEGCDEAFMVEFMNEIKAQKGGSDIDYWFCLQNYDKKNTPNKDLLLATPAARTRLAQFALSMCEKYGFVGVDIDYEYPETATQWENYSKFLIELKALLKAKGYKLSIALTHKCELSKEAVDAIDYVNIMAYSRVDGKNRHSSYFTALELIERWHNWGFEYSELVLGLPYYMMTISNYQGGQGYFWIVNRYRGAVKTYTNEINDAYFNGRDMIRDKTLLAIEKELSGVFSWSYDCDIPASDPRNLGMAVDETIKRFGSLAK